MKATVVDHDWNVIGRLAELYVYLLGGAFAVLISGGCAAPMTTFYRSVSTAATAGVTCFAELDIVDSAKAEEAHVLKAKGDDFGAAKAKLAWYPTEAKIRTACSSLLAAALLAKAAAPSIEAAIAKDAVVGEWVARLLKLGADAAAALLTVGVRL